MYISTGIHSSGVHGMFSRLVLGMGEGAEEVWDVLQLETKHTEPIVSRV